jgi:hypothetical protein
LWSFLKVFAGYAQLADYEVLNPVIFTAASAATPVSLKILGEVTLKSPGQVGWRPAQFDL